MISNMSTDVTIDRPLRPLERLVDTPSDRLRRVARIGAVVLPVAVTGYSVWYDALAARAAPDLLQVLVFVIGGLSLYAVHRWPLLPTAVAPIVWAMTGSCSFVVVMSAVVAARRGRGWWVVLGVFTVLHPLGLVPDPCMFRAGHVAVPAESAPLVAVVLPALVGGAVGEARRVVRAREERLRLQAAAAAARAADVVAQERLRLSRDLHDVVGQGVSRMTLHATALAAQSDDEATRRLATRIADSGAGLLEDLHFVVGLLRSTEAQSGTRQPAAPDAATLATPSWQESFDAALEDGQDVVRRGPAAGPLARTAGLDTRCAAVLDAVAAEALHNARKHAPGSVVEVTAALLPDRLEVTFRNAVPSRSDAAGVAARGGLPDSRRTGGHGLAVAAERAAEVGGLLRHARTPDGRFRLDLELPR
ncbi:signal transduction histidine kinase [Curtobacterium herbarum]|nr:signal transduction histidine kinase [Curtobacterium herbarum]